MSTIPPIPQKIAMVDNKGLLTRTWSDYFQAFFIRVGGTSANTNSQLLAAIENLGDDSEALETSIARVEANFAQGRAL